MANFDLIINLIVRNQEAIKNIGKDLKALEALKNLSKIVVPEISIPEPTLLNAVKFARELHDVQPIAVQISELLGPILIDSLIDATEALAQMARAASNIGDVTVDVTFDPTNEIEKSLERSRQSAQLLNEEIGVNLARSARSSADAIDDIEISADSSRRSSETSAPQSGQGVAEISLSPKTLDDTIALFDAIKATYAVTNQLSQALDKAGSSRSGQINAIAQALSGVSKLISDIYGVSINFNDKEIRAIATSIVALGKPLKDVGATAIEFKNSISMSGLDPSAWVQSYEKAAKSLGSTLGSIAQNAANLRKGLINANGDSSEILKLLDLKDLQSGLSGANQKAIEFKKNFDLKDLPKTIKTTATAVDDVARSLQSVLSGKGLTTPESGFTKLKESIAQVVEKYREFQSFKLPPLNSKDAVQLAQALGVTADKAKQLQQDLNLNPATIVTALNELNRFGAVKLPIREQFKLLNEEIGISRQQFIKLKELQSGVSEKKAAQVEPIALKVVDFGLGRVNADAQILARTFGSIGEKLQEIKANASFKPLPTNEAVSFAQTLGLSVNQARLLQKQLNIPTNTITSALNSIKQFDSVKLPIKEQFATLNKELGITKSQFEEIRKIRNIAPDDGVGAKLKNTFDGVTKIAFGYNEITTAVGGMVARVNPAYAAMIGANEKLNQQLLQSAATITATSAVSGADGSKLGSLDSIRSLQPKLKSTIREVEIATQSLVGVTSEQTAGVFNVILQNTGQLNGQLKQAGSSAEKFKDPLDAAAKLAPGMVATLGTLGLPLSQASDEIGNLLKGEIDQTAQVAKSLGITRQMVETWKSQGTLVDQLTKRFDPFLKANAEASRSVSGITSNIQDMFEIMGREAGKPVTALYVDALDSIYKYIQGVMPAVQEVFISIVEQQVKAIQSIGTSLKPLFDGVMTAVNAIGPMIEPMIRSSLELITNLFKTLEPVFSAVGQTIGAIGKAFAAMMPFLIQANAIFGVLASTTFNIGIALTALGAPLQVLVAGIVAVSGAIESIAKDPLGGILIQAIGLTVVLMPLVNTMLSFGTVVASIGSFFAWVVPAIKGMQTLIVVASGFLPFGAAISGALNTAFLAVNRFVAATITAAQPPILINYLKSLIVQVGLMAKAMLTAAVTSVVTLGKELGILAVQIIPRVIAGFAAMKAGGIAAGFAALTAGLPLLSAGFAGVAAATNLAAAAASKLLLAYGPLLVVVAAVGTTLMAKSAKDLADVNQEISDLSATNNAISDAALKTAQKLKALKAQPSASNGDAAKSQAAIQRDIELTNQQIEAKKKLRQQADQQNLGKDDVNRLDDEIKEQQDKLKKLNELKSKPNTNQAAELKAALSSAKQQISLIDDQIAANKKLREDSQKRGANQEQLNTFDTLIAEKEREKKMLSDLANEVKIASQPIAELGDTSTQMAQKVKAATAIVEAGVGDPQKYAAAAKELTTLLSKQVELGQVSASEAASQLASLKNNTKLDYESQLAAKEAIVKIYADRFSKIKELRSGGELSNSQAESELSQIQQNTSLELKTRQDAAKEIAAIRKETLDAELAELSAGTAKIEALKSSGEIGEAEAAKRTSTIKLQESQKRLESQRKEAEMELNPEVKRKLVAEAQKTEHEITKIKADEISRRNAERLKDFEEQDSILQAQLEKGAITEESYNDQKRANDQAAADEEISQLKAKLANLSAAEKEGREAIESQIAKAEAKKSQAIKAANDREIATLQSKVDRELAIVKAAEAEKLLTIAQAVRSGATTQAQADVEAARVAADAAQKVIEAEEKKLDKLRSLPSPTNPKDAEDQAKKIADQEAKFAEAKTNALSKQVAIEKAIIAEVAKANQDANEAVDRVQKQYLEESSKVELKALKQKGADIEAINRSVAKSNLAAERIAANDRYRSKQAELEELKKLIESGQISGEAAIEAERKLQKELADINLSRIALEKKALEELRAEKVRQIELEALNASGPAQKKIDLLNQQKAILEQQNALLSAQERLESASFNLAKQRYGFAIEDAKAAGNEKLARKLEISAAQEQLSFTRQQNTNKIESVRLSIEQRSIDAEMAKLTAEIATIQAKANLEKAIAEGKSQQQIDALRREVELRGKQEQLAGQAIENQKTIGEKELKAAQIEGQTAEERDLRALTKASAQPEKDKNTDKQGDDASSKKLEENTNSAAESNQKLATSSDAAADGITRFSNSLQTPTNIPARFMGGPIGSGELFTGAERGPELARFGDGTYQLLVNPGIYSLAKSAQIIPAKQTQQILQNASSTAIFHTAHNITHLPHNTDNTAVVAELRRLQSIVSSRTPSFNQSVHFDRPSSNDSDRAMSELARMMIRSGLQFAY